MTTQWIAQRLGQIVLAIGHRVTTRGLRLGSGLILFSYIAVHLANHALGLVALNVAEAGLRLAVAVWHSIPGTLLLYGAAVIHLALAVVAVHQRRTLRMPPIEALRIVLGFGMPLLLIGHFTMTRLGHDLYGLPADYRRIVWTLWTSGTEGRQLALLAPGWLHGCLGLNFAFGHRPLYQRLRPVLFGAALLLPVLAALGFLAMGRELAVLGIDRAWLEAHVTMADAGQRIALAHIRDSLLAVYLGVVALAFAARGVRSLFDRKRLPVITIGYPGRSVQVPLGWTVLEASRSFGIPHRADCGGRARCSTCRVRVIEGAGSSSPPGPDEQRTLERIRASPDVRLACQLRPDSDIAVVPLVAEQSDARRARGSQRLRRYDAPAITVTYDVKRCIHAHECTLGLPRVFNPGRRVWVDAKQANPDEIAEVVQRCPSGALHFQRTNGGAEEAIPSSNIVRITQDGPLYLCGELEIRTPTGKLRDTRAALCRCGASRNKPFCDRSHEAIAFSASGSLRITAPADGTGTGPLRVRLAPNGPCVIEGSFTLVSSDGATRVACGPKTALCRCGQSNTKPFCDGSHSRTGFRDTAISPSRGLPAASRVRAELTTP